MTRNYLSFIFNHNSPSRNFPIANDSHLVYSSSNWETFCQRQRKRNLWGRFRFLVRDALILLQSISFQFLGVLLRRRTFQAVRRRFFMRGFRTRFKGYV